nr:hypothetical protein [Propionicimonas sp.]
MPENLVVSANTVLTVGDDPGPELDAYVERVEVRTFSDLVQAGLIREKALNGLLDAGKQVTVRALENLSTTRDTRFVPGTRRLDLGRYTAFSGASAEARPIEQAAFWRFFREIEPTSAAKVTKDWEFASTAAGRLIKLLTTDCTIEAGATLEFTGAQKGFFCRHLLIRRTGRIVVRGGGVSIRATSIKGEQ